MYSGLGVSALANAAGVLSSNVSQIGNDVVSNSEHHPAPECADADRRERGQQSGSDGDELANRTSGEDGIRADGC